MFLVACCKSNYCLSTLFAVVLMLPPFDSWFQWWEKALNEESPSLSNLVLCLTKGKSNILHIQP